MSEIWLAPAKINLMLRILGRRQDGYHNLQTVFQFLDYADTLSFKLRTDQRINRSNHVANITADHDLTIKAARLLQNVTNTNYGVDISINKIIPIGGGLGGGSSNAATTLVALNRLWKLHLSEDQLADFGLKLGADVPVFIRGRAAWGEGIGEKLTPLDLPELWYLVVNPNCQIATAEIFYDSELTRDSLPIKISEFLAGDNRNDCEAVVRRRYPIIAETLNWLGKHARLTGTGACVYLPFDNKPAAEALLAQLPKGWYGFIAQGLNRSPLFEQNF